MRAALSRRLATGDWGPVSATATSFEGHNFLARVASQFHTSTSYSPSDPAQPTSSGSGGSTLTPEGHQLQSVRHKALAIVESKWNLDDYQQQYRQKIREKQQRTERASARLGLYRRYLERRRRTEPLDLSATVPAPATSSPSAIDPSAAAQPSAALPSRPPSHDLLSTAPLLGPPSSRDSDASSSDIGTTAATTATWPDEHEALRRYKQEHIAPRLRDSEQRKAETRYKSEYVRVFRNQQRAFILRGAASQSPLGNALVSAWVPPVCQRLANLQLDAVAEPWRQGAAANQLHPGLLLGRPEALAATGLVTLLNAGMNSKAREGTGTGLEDGNVELEKDPLPKYRAMKRVGAALHAQLFLDGLKATHKLYELQRTPADAPRDPNIPRLLTIFGPGKWAPHTLTPRADSLDALLDLSRGVDGLVSLRDLTAHTLPWVSRGGLARVLEAAKLSLLPTPEDKLAGYQLRLDPDRITELRAASPRRGRSLLPHLHVNDALARRFLGSLLSLHGDNLAISPMQRDALAALLAACAPDLRPVEHRPDAAVALGALTAGQRFALGRLLTERRGGTGDRFVRDARRRVLSPHSAIFDPLLPPDDPSPSSSSSSGGGGGAKRKRREASGSDPEPSLGASFVGDVAVDHGLVTTRDRQGHVLEAFYFGSDKGRPLEVNHNVRRLLESPRQSDIHFNVWAIPLDPMLTRPAPLASLLRGPFLSIDAPVMKAQEFEHYKQPKSSLAQREAAERTAPLRPRAPAAAAALTAHIFPQSLARAELAAEPPLSSPQIGPTDNVTATAAIPPLEVGRGVEGAGEEAAGAKPPPPLPPPPAPFSLLSPTPTQEVQEALDALGSQPWVVNARVLDVLASIWTDPALWHLHKKVGLPQRSVRTNPPPTKPQGTVQSGALWDRENHPTRPEAQPSSILFGTLLERPDVHAMRSHRKAVALDFKARAEVFALECEIDKKLDTARRMQERQLPFFLPHFLDFRGRCYPYHPYLSTMGADYSRALLLFHDGLAIGPDGFAWLSRQAANTFGNGADKLPLSERVLWAAEHREKIAAVADRPLTELWWTEAEEPFQFLAVCFELGALFKKDPAAWPEHVSFLPVHVDGSCNGLQHYAALGRDFEGGAAVNLVDGERPGDVYSAVSRIVERVVEADAARGVPEAVLLHGQVNRKLVKQTVMTSVYGVTNYGATEQVLNRLKERELPDEDATRKAARYAARLTLDGLLEMFSGAGRIMAWLRGCAERISRANELVTWTTPLGLLCVQPYRAVSDSLIPTVVQDVRLGTEDAARLRGHAARSHPTKQKIAFPPNYVHSLDSSHMMRTAVACRRRAIAFGAVHDSFWSHAGTMNQMGEILRDQFVALHKEALLQRLEGELRARYPEIPFEPAPELGQLEIEEVLRSRYFFS